MNKLPALALAVIFTVVLCTPQDADARRRGAGKKFDPWSSFGAELGIGQISFGPASVTNWVPQLHLKARLDDRLALSADWGLAINVASSEFSDESETETVIANPFVGFHYLFSRRASVGVGVAAPAASISNDGGAAQQAFAYVHAMLMNGAADLWLWAPDTVSVVVPFSFEDRNDSLLYGAESHLALLIPTEDGRDTEVSLHFGGKIGYAGRKARVGVKLQGVFVSDEVFGDDDQLQLSMAPFFQYRLGRGYLSWRLVMNLDEPAGFAFDDGKVWGMYFGGAGTF